MGMKEDYSKVIDYLINDSLDYQRIVVELAKTHPKVLLNILNPQRNTFAILERPTWMNEARKYLERGDVDTAADIINTNSPHEVVSGYGQAEEVALYARHLIFPYRSEFDYRLQVPRLVELAQRIAA